MSSRGQPDSWTIPGGGIEPRETPKVSAVREALEEVSRQWIDDTAHTSTLIIIIIFILIGWGYL